MSFAMVLRNISTRGSDRDFVVKLWRPSKALLTCYKFWRLWRQGSAEQLSKDLNKKKKFWRPSAEDSEDKVLTRQVLKTRRLSLWRLKGESSTTSFNQIQILEASEERRSSKWLMCDDVQKVHKVSVTSTLLEWRKV